MNFRGMKLIVPILLYMILGFGPASATSFYTWGGNLKVGQSVYLNDLTLTVDQDNTTGQLALIVENESGIVALIQGNGSTKIGNLTISFVGFNGKGYITVQGPGLFTVGQSSLENPALLAENARLKEQVANLTREISALKSENKKLKSQVDSLKKENSQVKEKLKSQPNTTELNAKIVNLTKENRELKAELANITRQYNALKAKADFLSQQNDEYHKMIQTLLQQANQRSTENYIQKAKKERLIGSVLWKSLIFALLVVGLVGYGIYRAKRRHEFAGL